MSEYARRYKVVLANGYSIIPIKPGDKAPAISKWSEFCSRSPTQSEADGWLDRADGLGLPCGNFVVAIDIDLLDPSRAAEAERRVLEIAGVDEAPVRTGRFPKRVLLFRPQGEIRSTSSRWKEAQYDEPQGFEILSSGKQVVAYGIHPKTAREYVWRGGSPSTLARDALPTLTPQMVDTIIVSLNALRPLDQPEPPKPSKKIERNGAPIARRDGVNPDAVRYIMERLPNTESTTWDFWVRIGFAIHKCLGDESFDVFDAWSSKSSRYDAKETQRKWATIVSDDRGDVGFGTLLAEANAHGIKLPPDIRFDPGEQPAPEIDIASYVDRIATVEVGPDGMSCADYWVYLNHVYSGPDDTSAIYAERCENQTPPTSVTAADIERVRAIVIKQLGGVGGESPRRLKVAYQSAVTLAHMREFFLQNIEEQEVPETDSPVSVDGLTIRLSPRDLPVPPAAARFKVPGLIAEFADWVDATSPQYLPEFGITSALSLVATLVGRSVKTPTGIRPNLYTINLLSSGGGKNNGIKRIRRALASVGALDRHVLGSSVTSGSAIRNRFERASGSQDDPSTSDGSSMSKIWLVDEFGGHWKQADLNAALGASIMTDLLTFFSASDEVIEGTAMAQKTAPSLPYPHLSVLGTSTATAMFEHMTMEHLRAGHANRFLVMEPVEVRPRSDSDKRLKWQGKFGHSKVPQGVVATMSALIRWCEDRRGLISSAWDDWAYTAPMEDAAVDFMVRVETLKESAVAQAERQGAVSEPFSRLDEMTCKLALLSAMSRLTESLNRDAVGYQVIGNPVIMETDVRFGFELARYSAERVAHVASNLPDDDDTAKIMKVMRIVRAAGSDGIPRSVLMQRARMSKRSLDGILETLTDSRRVIGVKSQGKTRPKVTYYGVQGAKRAISDGKLDPSVEINW